MHRLLLAFVLAACSSPPSPPDDGTRPLPPELRATAPAAAPTAAPPPAALPEAPVRDGAAYADKTLVILASEPRPGVVPDALRTLAAHPGLAGELELARLDSGGFKGLMPCYEVLVAGAFERSADAIALAGRLKDAGIDSYAKPAGAWVGARPAVQAYCERLRTGGSDSCGSLRFVERWGEKHFLRLGLADEVAERALEGAPPPRPVHEAREAWAAPLPAQTVGDLSVGQELAGGAAAGAPSTTCRVEGFVALTRGTPHFGWAEGSRSRPGCGAPELFAELRCEAPEVELARAGSLPPRARALGEVTGPAADAAMSALRASEAFTGALREAEAWAERQGEALKREHSVTRWELGGRELLVADLRLFTREGFEDCGGEDLNLHVRGVVTAGGEPVLPFRDASREQWAGLLDADGDGRPEVLSRSFPGTTAILDGDGGERCSVAVPYCDCPC